MECHVAGSASLRLSAMCPQCKLPLIEPERSERVSDGKTLHNWHCPVCGNKFETIDDVAAKVTPDDELIDYSFSGLLVA